VYLSLFFLLFQNNRIGADQMRRSTRMPRTHHKENNSSQQQQKAAAGDDECGQVN
jgi:hypothetical protein